MRDPQAFGQQQLQLVTQPLAPVAQIRAFVRELVLEKLLPGEVLEIRVMHPALADTLVGQSVDVLEQQQPNHEPGLNPRPAFVAVERRDLAVDPLPVDLACELHQRVLGVDDLLEPRPEQIARYRRLMLLRPHRSLRCSHRITPADLRKSSKRNCKLSGVQIPKPCDLKTTRRFKIRFLVNGLSVVRPRRERRFRRFCATRTLRRPGCAATRQHDRSLNPWRSGRASPCWLYKCLNKSPAGGRGFGRSSS